MTIMATHFAVVLGAWRLRVRIDIDEPSERQLHGGADDAPSANGARAVNEQRGASGYVPFGRG